MFLVFLSLFLFLTAFRRLSLSVSEGVSESECESSRKLRSLGGLLEVRGFLEGAGLSWSSPSLLLLSVVVPLSADSSSAVFVFCCRCCLRRFLGCSVVLLSEEEVCFRPFFCFP